MCPEFADTVVNGVSESSAAVQAPTTASAPLLCCEKYPLLKRNAA